MKQIYRSLKKVLGKSKILTSAEAKVVYASDASKEQRNPAMIVFPETTDEVIFIVKTAAKYGIPLTARGAGSGMSGGATPVANGMVISLARMTKIISIDEANGLAIVEPGVLTAKIQEAAGKVGLFYPPDPSSYKFCTIGGNIGENAGGLRCLKYGVTADFVMGVEYVNYRGELLRTGIFSGEDEGLDLTSLLCGSEGMLGIVVKAALKLIPSPSAFNTLSVEFGSPVKAAEAVTEILNRGILPCILEFIDRRTLDAIIRFVKINLTEGTQAVLLIEFDEQPELNRRWVEETRAICGRYGAVRVQTAERADEREALWKLRRSISPSLIRIASGKINEDIAVPRGRMGDLIEFTERLSREIGLNIPVYGHAGDGNLHVNLLYNRYSEEETAVAKRGVEKVLREVIRLGGTITGEHGVGLSKKPYLPLQFSESSMKLHRKIKDYFDKEGILNPDKMLKADL